jgi:hypothetical protein
MESNVRVGQQVPDNDQDGAPDGDDGAFRTPPPGDAPVTLTEKSLGPASADRGLAQDSGQVTITVPSTRATND